MKTSLLLLIASILLGSLALFAAPKPKGHAEAKKARTKPLDASFLRDYSLTRGFMLGRPARAKPTPDGKAVLFLRAKPREARMSLFEFDVASRKTRELLSPAKLLKGAEEKLTPEEKARRERMRVSVGGFTNYHLSPDGNQILLSLSGKLYLVGRDKLDVTELKTGAGTLLDPKFAPDGKSISYVLDHDIFVYNLVRHEEERITLGGSEEVTHGLAEFVAQEEMDRYTGYWWSPDSKQIVFEEADARGVEVWHVGDPAKPEREAYPSRYPRPGKANVKVKLGILALDADEPTWIDWDAQKHPYLAHVRWDRRGGLTITVQSRDQHELVLLLVDPRTGKTRVLAHETDDAWMGLDPSVPRWLDDDRFLWISDKNGGPQLELLSKSSKKREVLVPAKLGFQSLEDVDVKGKAIVYTASADPTQAQLYRLSLEKESKPTALTTTPGLHSAVFGKNHAIYVETTMASASMPVATVHQADGSVIARLPSVAEEPPFAPRVEWMKVGGGDGFYASIVRPHNFDPKKKYPVIDYVYGGPLHQKVRQTMNSRLIDQWLADQGFIVVSIDNRGTPGRGHDWEKAIYKKFGSVPLEGQVAGLKALGKKFPEMDLNRVGVFGWSYGGYLSALAVLRRPDMFKAGVAGAPVVDWYDYDTHYTERYLGVPKDEKDAVYRDASLLTYADKLERPLLLIHGTADDNVYFRHSLKLANALFRSGKEFDMLPLSGLTHMLPDPVVTERLWSRIAGYFHKHLGAPKPS